MALLCGPVMLDAFDVATSVGVVDSLEDALVGLGVAVFVSCAPPPKIRPTRSNITNIMTTHFKNFPISTLYY
ncbi:hypothetical protein D3C80_1818670 [compost metagenome]